jgi:hypothetical protein
VSVQLRGLAPGAGQRVKRFLHLNPIRCATRFISASVSILDPERRGVVCSLLKEN